MMRIIEIITQEQDDDPGPGPNPNPDIPLATIATPGAPYVDQEFALTGLRPLRRLRRLHNGGLTAAGSVSE